MFSLFLSLYEPGFLHCLYHQWYISGYETKLPNSKHHQVCNIYVINIYVYKNKVFKFKNYVPSEWCYYYQDQNFYTYKVVPTKLQFFKSFSESIRGILLNTSVLQ